MKKLLLAFFALPMLATAQIAQWNCTGAPAESVTLNATLLDPNLVNNPLLTRGPGAAPSAGGNSFRTVGFQNDGIAVTNTDYFEHTFEANTGYSLSFSSIVTTTNGTNSYVTNNDNGGVTMNYAYSIDGSAFVLLPNPQLKTTTGASAVTFNVSSVTALQNIPAGQEVKFRFYASGQTATGGWGYNVDGAIFNGALTPLAGCNISTANLTALTCNDNSTSSDSSDDYLTFSLNPAGTDIGATYTVSVPTGTITPTTGTYGAATSFQLQGGSAGAGNVVVTITDADESGCTYDVTITDPGACSSTTPTITVTPATLTGFNHMVGTPSTSQTFTTGGIALTENITLTASTGFQISLTSGGTYTSSLVLPHVTGIVAPTTIYVRGNAATYGAFTGNVVATSTGAVNDSVLLSGFANDYVYYTIDQIDGLNANGVADSLNVLVKVSGVVHCMDFRAGAGYNMTIIDGSGKGIYVFSNADVNGYTNPVAGDSISVRGTVAQFNGLLQIATLNSIVLETSGAATNAPIVVTALTEATENQYITLENVTLVTPIATFPTTATNVDVTNGTSTFQIRILPATDLAGAPAPQGPFNVTGIGSQFDSSSPYTSGYQLLPCGTAAIEVVCTGANLPSVATTLVGKTITATATGSVTYKWINCADNAVISGATAASYSPSAPGQYAVIVDNGTCSDTSACVTVDNLSIADVELGQSIVTFPNPVDNELTINNYSGAEVTFVVVDINGKVITENTTLGTNTVINTVSWNKGVYFVNFLGSNKAAHTVKIVK